jgi:hypothetical protein
MAKEYNHGITARAVAIKKKRDIKKLNKESLCPPEVRDYTPKGIHVGSRGARFFCPNDKGFKAPDKPKRQSRAESRIRQIEDVFQEARNKGGIYKLPGYKELAGELNELAREIGYDDYDDYKNGGRGAPAKMGQLPIKNNDAMRKYIFLRDSIIRDMLDHAEVLKRHIGSATQNEYNHKINQLNQIMETDKRQNHHWDDNMNAIMKKLLKIRDVTTTAHCGGHIGKYMISKGGVRLTAYQPYVNIKYSGNPNKFKNVLDHLKNTKNVDYRIINTRRGLVFSLIPPINHKNKLLSYDRQAIGL